MKKMKDYFKDYAAYHRSPGNQYTHMFGIPVIVMAILGLLDRIVLATPSFWPQHFWIHFSPALLLWIAVNAFYMRLHFWLGGSMVFTTGALFVLGAAIPAPALWALFVLGWIAQYVGHYLFEKKSPAFYKNLVHLVIGPAYIQNILLHLVQ